MLDRYIKFLYFLDEELNKMFSSQKPFIKCKVGCALCCKDGDFPMSELEYLNLLDYYRLLSGDLKNTIDNNIKTLLKSNNEENYVCPFLVKDICSVYPVRPIICRTFGLISFTKQGRKKIPFCVDMGLNYSEVFDKKSSKIIAKAPDGTEPNAYNIDRIFLRSKEFEQSFNIYFGEDKRMIDWLKDETWNV